MATFVRFYKLSQIPAALCIGYTTRKECQETNQPEIISNVSGVTIGIIGSYVWPGVAAVYGYKNYNQKDEKISKTNTYV